MDGPSVNWFQGKVAGLQNEMDDLVLDVKLSISVKRPVTLTPPWHSFKSDIPYFYTKDRLVGTTIFP